MKNPESVREAAIGYLSRRDHSQAMLQQKLLRKNYTKQQIDETLEWLTERGYLNDAALCRRVYERYVQTPQVGYYKIRYQLLKQGFPSELVQTVLASYDFDEEKMKLKNYLLTQGKTKLNVAESAKVARSLTAKGFVNENIRKVIEDIMQ